MLYLTVDGMMSGTGIRDSVEGGYLKPSDLGVSGGLAERISTWLQQYEEAHYDQYRDQKKNAALDEEGIRISEELRKELPEAKVQYYSNALMRLLLV
jgi:hypothetical protein